MKSIISASIVLMVFSGCLPGDALPAEPPAPSQNPTALESSTSAAFDESPKTPIAAVPSPKKIAKSLHLEGLGLVYNVSPERFPINLCRDWQPDASIWITRFPFDTPTKILNGDDADYYSPEWSNSSEWIAFVEVESQPYVNINMTTYTLREYDSSDSIWVMRPDGSDRRKIGGPFMRREMIALTGGCDMAGGITSFIGWSSNDRWVVYTYNDILDPPVLNVLNVNSGEVISLREHSYRPVWSHSGSKLAFITQSDQKWEKDLQRTIKTFEINVADLNDRGGEQRTYQIPLKLSEIESVLNVKWSEDDQFLFVALGEYHNRYSIWLIDTKDGAWSKVIDLGEAIPQGMEYLSGGMVMCTYHGGSSQLTFKNYSGLEIWRIDEIGGHNCSSVRVFKDRMGNSVISIVNVNNELQIYLVADPRISMTIPYEQLTLNSASESGFRISLHSWAE